MVINLSTVYIIVVMPTDSLTLYISGPSLEGVNQEANNVTSTEYQNIMQVVMMSLNLSMYFKSVCHRNVWCFTQFAIVALLYSGKAPSLHGQ